MGHWRPSKVQWAHIILLSCQLSFSGWHLIGSVTMRKGTDPFVFVMYRELFASLIMYALLRCHDIAVIIDSRDYLRFAFLGFCSFVNVVGAMLALKYISASRFAIFQPSIPCIATVISIFMGLEKVTILKSLGIILAVCGAILAEAWDIGEASQHDTKAGNTSDTVIGMTIVICQVIAMSCLVVFSKPILSKYHPSLVTFLYYSVGTIFTMFLFAGYAFQFTAQDLLFDSALLPWLALLYAVLLPTVYNYNALSWCGKLLAPSTTTVYMTFQPISTIFLSFIILHQVVTLPEGIGAMLVVLGLLVTVSSQQFDPHNPFSSQAKKDSVSSSLSSSSFSSNHSGSHLLPPSEHEAMNNSDKSHVYVTVHPTDADTSNDFYLVSTTDGKDADSLHSSGSSSNWSRQKQLVSVTTASSYNLHHEHQHQQQTKTGHNPPETIHNHLLRSNSGSVHMGAAVGFESYPVVEEDSHTVLSEISSSVSPLVQHHPFHQNPSNSLFLGTSRSRQTSGDTQSSGGLSSISSGRRSLTAHYHVAPTSDVYTN